MATVYSTQFIGGTGLASYSYTCPAGQVALLSCADCYISLPSIAGAFTLLGAALQVFWHDDYPAVEETYRRWRGKHLLTEGQTVTLLATGPFDASLSGDLLLAA